jgi:predicted nucleic acid-binding protein
MFLIDSSVWIEYLRPKGSVKVKERVKELLESGVVVCCGIVVIEIMRGARNKRDFDNLYDSFLSLPQIPIDEEVIGRSSRWGFEMDRKGKIVSVSDLVIASTAYKNARLLHIDSDFKMIAEHFNVEEEMLT